MFFTKDEDKNFMFIIQQIHKHDENVKYLRH